MKRFVIKTGGFSLILMLFLIITTFFFFIACSAQILDGLQGGDIVIIGGCILLIVLLISCFYYILMNKIFFFDDHINFQYLIRGSSRSIQGNVFISNISCVYIGKEKFVRNHLTKNQEGSINKFYKQFEHGLYSSSMRLGISYADVLVIILKNDNAVIINTKPFSRKGLRKLFREFESLNIRVLMQHAF